MLSPLRGAGFFREPSFEDTRLLELLSDLPKFVRTRIAKALFDKEVRTLEDLLKLGPVDLLKSQNIGRGSLVALESALEDRGLSLNTNRRTTERPTEYELVVGRYVAVIHRRAIVLEQRFRTMGDEDIPRLAREIATAAKKLIAVLSEHEKKHKRKRSSRRRGS